MFKLDNILGKIKDVEEKKDVAVIIFTSGSTGIPKGVMQSHYAIAYNSKSIIKYLDLTSKDRMMVVLPFSYCFGTSLLHTHFRVGGQVVLNNLFMFPGKVLKEINEKECTGFAGVPSTYQILLRRSALIKMVFPTLRLVQQAGGKLSKKFISELREALPTTKIFIMYGQTEATARLSYLPPEFLDTKLGSIGKGIPGTKLEVLNKEGKPIKPNEIGELVASGGNIMLGYLNDPEETAKTIKNGKLYTGDIGTIDEDGFIFLTDREKDFVKSGGFRVSPKEIENYISNLEDIVEIAIIGVPDDLYGEALKAFVSVKPKSNLTPSDVIDFCRKHYPPHKIPKEVEFMKTLPKNNSSKIDKPSLRKLEKSRKLS
ncbi:MAG: AMP-binding protein [archaeon]|nr:AMP-binding protein [archaeon]